MESVYVGKELSSAEKLAVEAIVKNYPDEGIIQVKAMHTADFTDEEDVPSGMLMIHPLSAKVHVDSLPLNAFTYLAIVPILVTSKLWEDSDFKSKAKLLDEAVPQFTDKPPTLSTRNVETSLDRKVWNTELGEDENAFAGVFKQTINRDVKYFICVQAGAPVACRQLRNRLSRNPLTFEQLLLDEDYNYCHYIAQRNVSRIAAVVSRAMSKGIRKMRDPGSFKTKEYSGIPYMAKPLYNQATTTIKEIVHNSEKVVGIFNKLTPVSNSIPKTFIYEGPYNGIAVFEMNGKTIGNSLPSCSGKRSIPIPLNKAEITQRMEGIICEGDITKHPDIAFDTFNPVNEESFLDNMESLGWKVQGLNNLIPVIVKIFNPAIKRKEVK